METVVKMQIAQSENVNLEVMKENLRELKGKLITFEWDKSHSQLNSSMELKYSQMKVEFEALQKKVDGLQAELKEHDASEAAKLEPAKVTE